MLNRAVHRAVVAVNMEGSLKIYIDYLSVESIPLTRQAQLRDVSEQIKQEMEQNGEVNLNFICTHNSRRSQFAQVWAQCLSEYFAYDVNCFSGGVEITECNPRTVHALEVTGFQVSRTGLNNPVYDVSFDAEKEPISLFSKLHSDEANPKRFIAIMTCDHADQNCPFIPHAVKRIPLTYIDPKASDGTVAETETYLKTSEKIATEMKFLFSQLP